MDRTIVAIATPPGEGGISVLRLSGKDALSIAEAVFSPLKEEKKLSQLLGYTAAYGHFYSEHEVLDDGVALVFRAPFSYTGEDVVELSCHGGIYLTNQILKALQNAGAILAEPGEFTRLAFLNGKMSLTQAESVMDLIGAESKNALRMAETARSGGLFSAIQEVAEELISLSGYFGAWFDYPEEDIEEISPDEVKKKFQKALSVLDHLIGTYEEGRIYREGIETVIIGKPNVGKSTLMNALSRQERSIVTQIPGTTRDVVEGQIRLGDFTLNLVDTAGIRDSEDVVEQMGINRAKERLSRSQLVLALFDGSAPQDEQDDAILAMVKEMPTIFILSKADLIEDRQNNFGNEAIFLSAKTGEGMDELEKAIEKKLQLHQVQANTPYLMGLRQLGSAQRAQKELLEGMRLVEESDAPDLISVQLESAIDALLELTGEKASERTVDEVFSRFCVGK